MKIVWQMTLLAYLIYMTTHFLPACLSHTPSRMVDGRSPSPTAQTSFLRDLYAAQEAVGARTTQDARLPFVNISHGASSYFLSIFWFWKKNLSSFLLIFPCL